MLDVTLALMLLSIPLMSIVITIKNIYKYLKSKNIGDLMFEGYEYIPIALSTLLSFAVSVDNYSTLKESSNLVISFLTLVFLFVIMIMETRIEYSKNREGED